MNDDGWYSSQVGKSTQPATSLRQKGRSKDRRRQTINEGKKQVQGAPVNESKTAFLPPEQATLVRRAKSYSAFYDVVRSHLKKELREEKQKKRQRGHLTNEVEFEDWYRGFRGELQEASHEKYVTYHQQLRQACSHLEYMQQDTSSTLDVLSSLSKSFEIVQVQTTHFQAQCEGILADQTRITKLADAVAENLQYYTYLEPITRRLNAPGAAALVRRSEFPEMLSNLDTCLDYMQEHPKQKEAATYATKYRLLLTRALTLIRNYFANSLRDIAADISKRIADRQLNDATMSALLYAKFRVPAPELKEIGQELEKRAAPPAGAAPGTEGEYQSLMNELYQNYAATRAKLLTPVISKKMAEMAAASSASKDLVGFARSAIGFMRSMCADEYDLWGEWFNTENLLYPLLESLCEPLYDTLLPLTIHETRILKLCELCALIQTRYLEDSDSEDGSLPDTSRLDFARLIQPALQDAQDRLVFLVQVVVRNDIQYFKPKPEHLDYPRKASRVALSGTRNPPVLAGRKESNGPISPTSRSHITAEDEAMERDFLVEPGLQEVYPTLRKAVWLLSRIYRMVNSAVFDSLAHEIVHQTTLSITTASSQIATRVSPTDSQLFLLSHLLLLKHHILAFDIEFASPDVRVDFTSSLWDLRDGLLNPAKLMRALSGGLVPRVITDMKDARIELDERLRSVIGELVGGWAGRMTSALTGDGENNGNQEKSNAAEQRRGRQQQQAKKPVVGKPDAVTAQAVREAVMREVPLVRRKLDEYIHDKRTRNMLLRAVLEDVLAKYASWIDDIGMTSPKARSKGKGREDGVWEESVFAEWAVDTFGLHAVDMEDDQVVDDV